MVNNLYLQAMASMIEVYSRVRGAQGDNRFAITSQHLLWTSLTFLYAFFSPIPHNLAKEVMGTLY